LTQDGEKIKRFNLTKTINRLVIVVSIGIVAHLIFLLLTNDQNVFQYLHKIKIPYLFLILFFLSLNWIGHAFRIVLWTRYLKKQFSFKQALKIAIYTELGAAVTPTLIGGGPIKLGLLIRNGLSTGKAGFLTLLSGFEDFVMYLLVFLISCIHAKKSIGRILNSIGQTIQSNWMLILGVIVTIVIIRLILIKTKTPIGYIPAKYKPAWNNFKNEMLGGWQEMLSTFKQLSKDGWSYFFVSFPVLILQWMSKFTVLVILLYALGISFKPFEIYIQQWIVYLTMIFVPTPGATGGAEATFFLLFEGEIPKDLLPLVVSTWRFFMYYLMLFASVFIIQFFRFKDHE